MQVQTCKYVHAGGSTLTPPQPQQAILVDQWLEWDEACLKPCTYLGRDKLAGAATQLTNSLHGGVHLVGSDTTAADVSALGGGEGGS